MSLANLQGKMNRKEMKNIFGGGSGDNCANKFCSSDSDCCTQFPKCASTGNWGSSKVCAYNDR